MKNSAYISPKTIAQYIMENDDTLCHNGIYTIYWCPEVGLNYNNPETIRNSRINIDLSKNISVSVDADYLKGTELECEIWDTESYNNNNFMSVCEKLAEKLSLKIKNELPDETLYVYDDINDYGSWSPCCMTERELSRGIEDGTYEDWNDVWDQVHEADGDEIANYGFYIPD